MIRQKLFSSGISYAVRINKCGFMLKFIQCKSNKKHKCSQLIIHSMQRLRVTCNDQEKLTLVQTYITNPGFEYLGMTNEQIDLFVTAKQISTFKTFLEDNYINYEVIIDDVYKKAVEEFNNQQLHMENNISRRMTRTTHIYNFSYYMNYDQIIRYMRYLAKNFKNFVKMVYLGKTYESRPMYLLHISKPWGTNKSAVFIEAGIHAREWIAPITALYMIDQLIVNKTNNYLLHRVDFYILPVLNPDGYQHTHDKPENRYWRKTRSYTNNSDCIGVDANRNFDFKWNVGGALADPCSNTFPGFKPFSEPETQNLKNFLLSKDGSIKIYLSLHSAAQCLLYPWGYKSDLPPNEPVLRQVAMKAAQAMYSVSKTIYKIGTPETALRSYKGPVGGTSLDWAMGTGGAELSYVLELPAGEEYDFIFPIENVTSVGRETFEGLKVFVDYVDPWSTTIIHHNIHNAANNLFPDSIKVTVTMILVSKIIINKILGQV